MSYKVKLSDGRIQRRHVDHLRYRYPDTQTNQEDREEWPLQIPRVTPPTPAVVPPPLTEATQQPGLPLRRSGRNRRPVDR